jgi:hypothetical protein
MLYDPKWEVEVKADPFSLESLIAWLEKQPENKSYRYTCIGHCLLAQYFTAMGFERVSVQPYWFKHSGGIEQQFSDDFENIAVAHDGRGKDKFTFGAALKRARAALSDMTKDRTSK